MDRLPVELVYEIQLCALEPALPIVSRRLFAVFHNASPLFRAQYILATVAQPDDTPATIYSAALRFPLCTQPVFARLIEQCPPNNNNQGNITLPKRLFRALTPNDTAQTDALIKFLRFMTSHPTLPPINANSHDGYVLTRAVYARSPALVSLLLDHNANPRKRANLAVKVAIRQKDVQVLKLLLESRAVAGGMGGGGGGGKETSASNKRRKVKHRITPDATMLRLAVDSGAEEIVAYLYRELRVVPDLETLKRIVL